MSVVEADKQVIANLLGREPRGLEAVAYRDSKGVPMVIRVAPLVANKPFPTLFWLVDKRLNYAIDQLEASGFIAQLQSQVDAGDDLRQQLLADHQAYIDLRQSYITEQQRQCIRDLGYEAVLVQRGIGGIADFQRIRCLHTYYAAHLVNANTIGRLLDAHWQQTGVHFAHFQPTM